uniref:Plectin/eS10 N-terminal domain-containing protein n=1 Tax=Laticauda laticaudata TaxID=8630 RepID=A0A8C5RWV1_LATLA
MLMPLGQLRGIYERLFRDGVLVGQKDPRPRTKVGLNGPQSVDVQTARYPRDARAPVVRESFAWRHCYWYLTDEGIAHLRQYLRLPPEIVPTTLQRARRPLPVARPASRPAGGRCCRRHLPRMKVRPPPSGESAGGGEGPRTHQASFGLGGIF